MLRGPGRGGDSDLDSSLAEKFGHQIRGKTWEVLESEEAKIGKES